MKRTLTFISMMLITFSLIAGERETIWPKGKMPDVQTNQCKPYLEWHMPKTLKTKAIQILYSGGAYNNNKISGHRATGV